MSESRFFYVSREGKIVGLSSMAEAIAETQKGGFVWLDYSKPTKEDLSLLMEPFGLHPLSIEDCLDENLIPKIDDYPRYTFFIFNSFHYVRQVLTINEINIFLGTDFLITVNVADSANQQLLKSIEKIVEINPKKTLQGPAFLLHVILDYIVDQKYAAIEAFENDLDDAEATIISDLSNFNPSVLLNLRRDLFAIRRSLFHEREIMVKIYRKDCPFIPEKALFYYRDIYDHLTKFFEMTETARDVVTSLMEMYLSMLNNRMAETANKTNRIVRRLTFITTIFMPLTLLAGIGGMSEWSMMTGPQNWKISYPLFLLAMVIIGIVNYYLLRWLEKKPPRSL
jgi:magnesium transporter